MANETITISLDEARRLFVIKQHLMERDRDGDFKQRLISLIRDIGYIQWDPVSILAPSHLISIWSRLGKFDLSDLEQLLWNDRMIFLHWTPTAVLVSTEDYPIFHSLMKRYPESLGNSWASHIKPAKEFLESHHDLRKTVMDMLRTGPADARMFKGIGRRVKSSDGWSSGNEVTTLLYHLHMSGEVMVCGHNANQNVWSLTDAFLPDWAEKKELSIPELESTTALRALKALGVGSEYDINRYFVRGRYIQLSSTLEQLQSNSRIVMVKMHGGRQSRKWFIRSEDIKLLESLEKGTYDDHMRLISPFDNILSNRERAKAMFNFEYTLEQFVPMAKRKYGTYVLPILFGDRLVGRIDARLDKTLHQLNVNAVYAEPGHESDLDIPSKLAETVQEFADFLNAEKISYGERLPKGWVRFLK